MLHPRSTPDPPLINSEQNRRDCSTFADRSEDDYEWEDRNGGYWAKVIVALTARHVLESIRDKIGEKIRTRQAFNIVLNLTDVTTHVTAEDVAGMLRDRPIRHLAHVLAVVPTGRAKTEGAHKERITGQVKIGGMDDTHAIIYEPDYSFDLYDKARLTVEEIFSPND